MLPPAFYLKTISMKESITFYGNRLYLLRIIHQYSMDDLADKLEVSKMAISKWEKGDLTPNKATILGMAAVFNVNAAFFTDTSTAFVLNGNSVESVQHVEVRIKLL